MINLEREANKEKKLIREGKRVQQIEPENTELILKIFKGFTINERALTQPFKGPEYYRVVVWTNTGNEYGTKGVKAFYKGFSCFNNEKLVIPLDNPADQYLYIELHRGVTWADPGTSNGTIVMGRAKIRLPPPTRREITCKVDLVGLNSDRCVVSKGYLELSMQLHRYVIR